MSKTHIFILLVTLAVIAFASAYLILFPNTNKVSENSETNSKQTSIEQKDINEDSELAKLSEKLNLKNYKGENVSLDDYIGTPLVINSWAIWCPFCVEELKEFAQAQKEFEGKAIVIAINRSESASKTKEFTDELGVTDDMLFLLDPNDSFYKNIGGFSMPETIFVDGEGNIEIHKRGPMNKPEIEDKILEIL